jgi:hypothetical protein
LKPRLLSLLLIVILLLAACNSAGSATEELPLDPKALLDIAIKNIRATSTFRLLLEQTGADYQFKLTVNETGTELIGVLRRAEAQFVAPDTLYATTNLSVQGLPLSLEIYAQDTNQWLRLPGAPWLNIPFAAGFNPGVLLAADSGFQKALSSLLEMKYMGKTALDDGTPVFHVTGKATGANVKDLLVGLVETASDVVVDVYVAESTRLPALVVVTQPNSATESQPTDTSWRVEIYDVNADLQMPNPEATAQP